MLRRQFIETQGIVGPDEILVRGVEGFQELLIPAGPLDHLFYEFRKEGIFTGAGRKKLLQSFRLPFPTGRGGVMQTPRRNWPPGAIRGPKTAIPEGDGRNDGIVRAGRGSPLDFRNRPPAAFREERAGCSSLAVTYHVACVTPQDGKWHLSLRDVVIRHITHGTPLPELPQGNAVL